MTRFCIIQKARQFSAAVSAVSQRSSTSCAILLTTYFNLSLSTLIPRPAPPPPVTSPANITQLRDVMDAVACRRMSIAPAGLREADVRLERIYAPPINHCSRNRNEV